VCFPSEAFFPSLTVRPFHTVAVSGCCPVGCQPPPSPSPRGSVGTPRSRTFQSSGHYSTLSCGHSFFFLSHFFYSLGTRVPWYFPPAMRRTNHLVSVFVSLFSFIILIRNRRFLLPKIPPQFFPFCPPIPALPFILTCLFTDSIDVPFFHFAALFGHLSGSLLVAFEKPPFCRRYIFPTSFPSVPFAVSHATATTRSSPVPYTITGLLT